MYHSYLDFSTKYEQKYTFELYKPNPFGMSGCRGLLPWVRMKRLTSRWSCCPFKADSIFPGPMCCRS